MTGLLRGLNSTLLILLLCPLWPGASHAATKKKTTATSTEENGTAPAMKAKKPLYRAGLVFGVPEAVGIEGIIPGGRHALARFFVTPPVPLVLHIKDYVDAVVLKSDRAIVTAPTNADVQISWGPQLGAEWMYFLSAWGEEGLFFFGGASYRHLTAKTSVSSRLLLCGSNPNVPCDEGHNVYSSNSTYDADVSYKSDSLLGRAGVGILKNIGDSWTAIGYLGFVVPAITLRSAKTDTTPNHGTEAADVDPYISEGLQLLSSRDNQPVEDVASGKLHEYDSKILPIVEITGTWRF